ncbi:MAG: membrane protein insertase YidC [Myxococcota bacterium]
MEQKRFLLAMALSAGVLLVWQLYFAPEPKKPQDEQQKQEVAQKADVDGDEKSADGDTASDDASDEDADSPDDEAEPADNAGSDEGAEVKKVGERDVEPRQDTIRSEHFEVELTNKGGAVKHVRLHSPEQYQAAGDLVGFPEDASNYPFEMRFMDKNFDFPEDAVFSVAEDESKIGDDGKFDKIVYRYDDPQGRFRVDKVFEISPEKEYVLNMDVVVTNKLDDVNLVDTLAVDTYGWKDPNQESSWFNFLPNELEGVCRMVEDTERETYGSLEEPLSFSGGALWGAVDTRYFMLATVPLDGAEKCDMEIVDTNYVRTRLTMGNFSVAPGSTKTLAHELYLGPKDVDVLQDVGHQLSDSVDYGFFAFIARPMRWGLNFIQNYVGNWGLAIILLTFLIRGAIWPINMKAYSSMERMKEIQPELEKVREKYEDDRQKMGDETMKLFREHNVSPAGGCLPMLLQMPILYGLYVMIYNSVELYEADFMLWYTNLAVHDPYYVLPALMGITMFAQQKMSTVDTSNKQAAMMMKVMPVMFTAFMAFLPSGLVLYYFFSLLIGVVQQYFVKRKFRTEGDAEKATS